MKIAKKIIFSLVLGLSLLAVLPVSAQTLGESDLWGGQQAEVGTSLGLPQQSIQVTIANIIRVAMGLIGIVMVVIILYGGFLWMTAGGNEDKVGEAKKWIYSGVMGLIIILTAYAIANFVISSLVQATTGTP